MRYVIQTLEIERHNLLGLVRTIEKNIHIVMNDIPHQEELNRIAEIERAIVILNSAQTQDPCIECGSYPHRKGCEMISGEDRAQEQEHKRELESDR